MDKRLVLIAGIGLALLLAAAFVFVFALKGCSQEQTALLRLAEEYIARGDYDRALDILDKLILKNPDDADIARLREAAMAKKAEEKAAGAALKNPNDELAHSLGELGKTLEKTASSVNASQAAAAAAQKAALENSASQAASQAAARKAEEEARTRAEAEAAAARKKAADEELARKSREMREKMEAVNALVKKGRAAIQGGDYAAARAAFDSAVSAIPAGETLFAAQAYADIAEAYYEGYKRAPQSPDGLDSVKRAQHNAQEAIRNNSSDAVPHYTLSKIYNDFDKTDLAIAELEQAVKLDPKNYLYAYELGKACFKVKKYAEAQRSFESITTKLNPTYEPAYFNLGMTYKALGNTRSALQAFNAAIRLKPDYVRAHIEAARIQLASDAQSAVKSYQAALSFEAGNIAALREIGVAYTVAGKNADAEKAFAKALSLSPDAQTAYNLAKVQFDLGKASEALSNARKAVEEAPTIALYQYQLGLCAEKTNDTDGALRAYAKAAELDNKNVDARINLGRLYLEAGFADKALAVLDEAYRIAPRSLEANNNLANAYGAKSMFDKSVFHYEAALALAPRDSTTRLNLARAYVQSGALPKAKDSYIELLKLEPNNWDALYELGKVYVSLSDQPNAKKVLTDLLAKKPDFKARSEVETILSGL